MATTLVRGIKPLSYRERIVRLVKSPARNGGKHGVCSTCYHRVPLPCVACAARNYRELKGGAA